jgi:hypothetical protein
MIEVRVRKNDEIDFFWIKAESTVSLMQLFAVPLEKTAIKEKGCALRGYLEEASCYRLSCSMNN